MKNVYVFMSKHIHSLLFSGFLCFFLAAIIGCEQPPPQLPPPTFPPLVLTKARLENVQLYEIYTGKTVEFQSVNIVPRVKGFIEEINYVPGEIVEPGQVLFTIQDFDYKIAKSKAYAELYQAVTAAKLAKKLYESALRTNQITPKTIPEDEIAQKHANYLDASTRVYAAQAEYQFQTQQLYYTLVTSPIRGKAQQNLIDVGNFVGAGGREEILTTVVEMDPMHVDFEVSDGAFSRWYSEMVRKMGGPKIGPREGIKAPPEETGRVEAGEMVAPEIPYAREKYLYPPPALTEERNEEKLAEADREGESPHRTFKPETETETEAAAASHTENRKKPLVITATPEIPLPEENLTAKTREVSGTGIAGERYAGTPENEQQTFTFEMGFLDEPGVFPFRGTLTYADNKINPATGTIRVRGEFPNPHYEVYPGRIVQVRIPSRLVQDAMVVDERAVGEDLNTKFVWVVNPDGTAEKRYIQAEELLPGGRRRIIAPYREEVVKNLDESTTVVRTGLKPGEKYIVAGFQKVRAGMKVVAPDGRNVRVLEEDITSR